MADDTIVAVPLRERPAKYSATLGELRSWRDAARRKEAGNEAGLRPQELETDLQRYLEDAVVLASWTWEEGGDGQLKVQLRTSMEELDAGWSERVDKRRPLEFIVGCVRWRDMLLVVQEGVLIPRIETEQFVDLARDALLRDESLRYGIWADLGTGSGAIAIGIARLLGKGAGPVIAVDANDVPLAVAQHNVHRCHVEDTVTVVRGSWFSPFADKVGQLAAVVSNPPYVPSENIPRMRNEACKHEPLCAMDGGKEGLDHLLVVCDGAFAALRPGGFLALETDGGKQAHRVAEYLTSGNLFESVTVVKDYADIDRFVVGYRA